MLLLDSMIRPMQPQRDIKYGNWNLSNSFRASQKIHFGDVNVNMELIFKFILQK